MRCTSGRLPSPVGHLTFCMLLCIVVFWPITVWTLVQFYPKFLHICCQLCLCYMMDHSLDFSFLSQLISGIVAASRSQCCILCMTYLLSLYVFAIHRCKNSNHVCLYWCVMASYWVVCRYFSKDYFIGWLLGCLH